MSCTSCSWSYSRSPQRLGCAESWTCLGEVLEQGASYERQRAVVATGGGLTDVVDALVTEFAEDRFVLPGEVANAE